MNILVVLVPLALGLGGLGLAAFMWSMRAGQFDDLEGAGARALLDDDIEPQTGACGGAAPR
jgi:cbb3-type cytochrome oxidase maturation protein